MSNVPPPPPPSSPTPPPAPTAAAPTAVAPTAVAPAPPTVAELTGVGPSNVKLLAAEAVGTFVLMIVGPGTAILAATAVGGALGVSLAFGFALLAMAYTIGHVSGCHINPAVTLAFLVSKKLAIRKAVYYWIGQVIGAVLGGLVLFILSRGDRDQTTVFAANGWGEKINSNSNIGMAMLVEVVFTALLIFVVLSTTGKGYPAGFGGIAAGLTLAMIHLATIPVDNTSVNPARSLGTAVFGGGDALGQLWVFIVFPAIGGVVGVLVWLMVHDERLEDTMFGGQSAVVAARDRAAGVVGQVEDRLG